MSTHRQDLMTEREAARELFVAGYLLAVDDMHDAMLQLGVSRAKADSARALMAAKAAMVKTRAAIDKAAGEA